MVSQLKECCYQVIAGATIWCHLTQMHRFEFLTTSVLAQTYLMMDKHWPHHSKLLKALPDMKITIFNTPPPHFFFSLHMFTYRKVHLITTSSLWERAPSFRTYWVKKESSYKNCLSFLYLSLSGNPVCMETTGDSMSIAGCTHVLLMFIWYKHWKNGFHHLLSVFILVWISRNKVLWKS